MTIHELSADLLYLISNYIDNPLFYPLDSLSKTIQENIYTLYNKSPLQLGIYFINKNITKRFNLLSETEETIKSYINLINKAFCKYSNNNVITYRIFNKYLNPFP